MKGTRLTNQEEIPFDNLWNSDDLWSLKAESTIVCIKNDSKDMVLGIDDSDTTVGFQSFVEDDDKQKWEKGEENQDGFFTLTNHSLQMVLTATTDQTLELCEGNYCIDLRQTYLYLWIG